MMPRADSSSNDPRAGMRWFFFVAAAIFVVVIAVGFAPTFYLRGLLESHVLEGALTPYIILHGIVLTSWYGLFLAQTWLVATGRTGRHCPQPLAAGSRNSTHRRLCACTDGTFLRIPAKAF